MQNARYIPVATFILLGSISLSGFFCTDLTTNAVEVKPGEQEEVLLKEGKSVEISPENITVEFSRVEGDSRCPEDVVCVWQGEAEITLTLFVQRGRMYRSVKIPGLVNTPYRGASFEAEGYRFSLVQLDPYPRHADGNTSREYIAHLEIEKL